MGWGGGVWLGGWGRVWGVVAEIKQMRDSRDAANSTGESTVVSSDKTGCTPFHIVRALLQT